MGKNTMTLEAYLDDVRARQSRHRGSGWSDEVDYPIGRVTLPAHVEHWAGERPDRVALVDGPTTMTYRELDDAHRRVAGWLREHGVTKGDRVAVHLGNRHEFVVTFLAVLRLGAVHVPVNPMFSAHEVAHELRDSEARIIVTSSVTEKPARDGAAQVEHECEVVVVDDGSSRMTDGPRVDDDAGEWNALAALNYTGGTTGLPKGCCHSQGDMVYTAASTAQANGLDDHGDFTALCYLPIFWIAGEDLGILLPVVLGGTSVLLSRWNADAVLDAVEEHHVQVMVGTVENYLELMARDDIGSRDLSSLTDPQAVSFVRKMTPEVRASWTAAVPDGGVLREAAYGMTETHTMDTSPYGLHADDMDLRAEPVFCGLPVPGTDIAVVEFGTQTPVPVGETGEIIVRSPSVTSGYWRNEEATRRQLVDGWLHTGDNGRIDDEGFVHYLGRDKEMIKVKGMSVFPAEVEMAVAAHPAVVACAVVAKPDDETGERPVAFVTVTQAVDADRLREFAAERLAAYKVPEIRVIEAMPMTPTGKIRKNELGAQG